MIGNKNQCINWLLETEADIFEVNIYKKQRNNDQNAKYWKLLNELAKKIRMSVDKLHFEMLKSYSVRYEILVPSETTLRGIEYYEKKSTIKKNDKYFNVYHVYTPSHELKTDEFAILLDGLIQECEQQGIDTRSPEEIERDSKLYDF